MANASVQLKANNGQYICAENSGGELLVVNRDVPLQWESFILINIQGTSLQDGSLVGIKCNNGQYVCAENGGGSTVVANRNSIGPWETFTIKKNGGGAIQSGDNVAFLCSDGQHYLSAEGGGGGQLFAYGKAIDIWETFVITVLPPRHIRIEIESIYCKDTEDVTGEDELYFAGAGVNRNDKQVTPVLTTPIGINDGQTKQLPPDQRIVFDGTVEAADTIVIGLKAYDEDAAKNWGDRGEKLSKIASAVSAGLSAAGPQGVVAGAVIELTVGLLNLIISLDKDDDLGTWNIELPVLTLPIPESRLTWDFYRHRKIGYSTWDYKVTFLVLVN